MERIICWFSCGAASAVAAKKTLEIYGKTHKVEVVYCNLLASEHPQNRQFLLRCQLWFEHPIGIITSDTFQSIDEVFETTKYMSGVRGARCTTEMKKIPRLAYAQPDDIHVFGFTSDEGKRIKDFEKRNPELRFLWVLRDLGLTKMDCYNEITYSRVGMPKMYLLGYRNNNCLGCVKSSSPGYWSKIRKDFPEVFKRRCEQSRKLGVRLVEIKHHVRIFLDELPDRDFPYKGENISCGPECGSPS